MRGCGMGGLARLPQDVVLADPGPADLFDDRVYKRGALTLHALRLSVGDEAFFGLLREWTARFRHATVTTAGFLETVSALVAVGTWAGSSRRGCMRRRCRELPNQSDQSDQSD